MDLAELYRRYAAMVLRRVLRFFPRDEGEEIVHEVFLRVVERAESFRADASPTTWLYRVTTNHCLNRLRDDARRRELWLEHGAWSAAPVVQEPDQEAQLQLRDFWGELDDDLLAVCVYYYVDGMSQDEIARVVGCSRATVGNRLAALRERARAKGAAQ